MSDSSVFSIIYIYKYQIMYNISYILSLNKNKHIKIINLIGLSIYIYTH
jgi:hypothetical protein